MQVIWTVTSSHFFWFIAWAFNISNTIFTSWTLTVAKQPALHLHLSSPRKSSLRTMVSQRMWSLLPAVLAQKKTHEQMASPTWDPHFPPGGWFTGLICILNIIRTRTENFPHAHLEGIRITHEIWYKCKYTSVVTVLGTLLKRCATFITASCWTSIVLSAARKSIC